MSLDPIYKIVKMPIDSIMLNPSNPRGITESKFDKLVQSIKEAPWMLKLRPIVVNHDGIILGGNQRYKACQKAGMDHVWVMWVDKITDTQQRRFILRDNIDFGKWDQEILKKHYAESELIKYGIEIELLEQKKNQVEQDIAPPPVFGDDEATEPKIEDEELEKSKKNFNENTIQQIVFIFPNDIYEKTLKDLNQISIQWDCDDNSEVFIRLLNYYEISMGFSNDE
jgi:hypothetical protein